MEGMGYPVEILDKRFSRKKKIDLRHLFFHGREDVYAVHERGCPMRVNKVSI